MFRAVVSVASFVASIPLGYHPHPSGQDSYIMLTEPLIRTVSGEIILFSHTYRIQQVGCGKRSEPHRRREESPHLVLPRMIPGEIKGGQLVTVSRLPACVSNRRP